MTRFAADNVDQPASTPQNVGAGVTLVKFRTKHRVYADGHFLIPNYAVGALFAEVALGGSARTLKMSGQIGAGTVVPFTFSSASSISIDPTVASIVAHDDITAGQFGVSWPQDMFVIQEYTITASDTLPMVLDGSSGITGEGTVYGGSTQVLLGGALTGGTANTKQCRPVAYIGNYTGVAPMVVGDSIAFGALTGSTYDIGSGTGGGGGYFARAAVASALPYYKMAKPGSRTYDILPSTCPLQLSLVQYATHCDCQMGMNDGIVAGDNSLSMKVNSRVLRTLLRSYNWNLHIEQGAVTLNTTSSDSWATTANQTLVTGWAISASENATVNANIIADVGFYDLDAAYSLRSVMADGVSLDKWAVTGAANYATADGIHPSVAMHALMATLRSTSLSGFTVPSQRVQTYDAAATAVFAALSSAATPAQKKYYNDLILWWKQTSIWTPTDILHLFNLAPDAVSALLNVKNPGTFNASIAASAPVWTANQGYATDGVDDIINLYNPSTAGGGRSQNSGSLGFRSNTSGQLTNNPAFWFDGTDGDVLLPRNGSDALGFRINQASGTTKTSVTSGAGLFAINRSASNATQLYIDGVAFVPDSSPNLTSTALNNHVLQLGSGVAASFAAMQFAVVFGGGSLDATAHANIYSSIQPLLTLLPLALTFTFNPVISSNGGGSTAAVSAAENQTAVTTVVATLVDTSGTLTYSISGGADQAKFSIVGATGVLTFASAPNFEAPTDANADNVYEVTVQVSDGTLTDTQAISVTVTDVDDTGLSDPGWIQAAIHRAHRRHMKRKHR